MTVKQQVEDFIASNKYDIRISKNGRWIDQKCTYDVVNFVADCVAYYLENGGSEPFHSPQIWKSDYAVQFVQDVFGKPYPLGEEPHDEFNKFFRQPLKMLAAAGVLNEEKETGNTINFSVANREVLDFIALRPWNAQEFLAAYIEKTLTDSGLWPAFKRYFDAETSGEFNRLKDIFERFCYQNTPINNKAETGRVFPKVLNPLAFKLRKKGAIRGRISGQIITLSDLTYNRPNWRDTAVKKDKNIARRSFSNVSGSTEATKEYLIRKQMKILKQFNKDYMNSKSEVIDRLGLGEPATQAHHMFPKSKFPEIADCIENLIMLTSGQHYEKAHPNGSTQEIDFGYQYLCLVSKAKSIKENIENDDGIPVIYDFNRFVHVLNTGFQTDYFEMIDLNDFSAVEEGIEVHYPSNIRAQYNLINLP